jgi:hypothetical protein
MNHQNKEPDAYTTNHFSLANPAGEPNFRSLPKLLRRVADRIEARGDDVVVGDLLLDWGKRLDPETYWLDAELGPTVTVYYSRETKIRGNDD